MWNKSPISLFYYSSPISLHLLPILRTDDMLTDSCVDAAISVLFLSAVKPDYSGDAPQYEGGSLSSCDKLNYILILMLSDSI